MVADTNVRPGGSRSLTCTPVALLGPLLVATTVKVTFWPTFGDALSTLFVSARSAVWPLSVTEALSFAAFGSGWLPPERVAVLVMLPARVTVAVMLSVATEPFASAPTLQTPLVEL